MSLKFQSLKENYIQNVHKLIKSKTNKSLNKTKLDWVYQ